MRCAGALADVLLPARVAGRLRVAKAASASRRYPRRIVEHRYGESTFKVLIGSPYGERYDADWPALPEIEALRRSRLQPGTRAFDLGANHGVMAMMLADVVGPAGNVIALRPARRAMASSDCAPASWRRAPPSSRSTRRRRPGTGSSSSPSRGPRRLNPVRHEHPGAGLRVEQRLDGASPTELPQDDAQRQSGDPCLVGQLRVALGSVPRPVRMYEVAPPAHGVGQVEARAGQGRGLVGDLGQLSEPPTSGRALGRLLDGVSGGSQRVRIESL